MTRAPILHMESYVGGAFCWALVIKPALTQNHAEKKSGEERGEQKRGEEKMCVCGKD